MVRLVFRPYTRIRRSICTSEPLRTSTRVSPGFILSGHSSPSFGSQRVRSHSVQASNAQRTGRRCAHPEGMGSRLVRRSADLRFRCAPGLNRDPLTRAHVRLLGPCFKTGQVGYRPTRRQPATPTGPFFALGPELAHSDGVRPAQLATFRPALEGVRGIPLSGDGPPTDRLKTDSRP